MENYYGVFSMYACGYACVNKCMHMCVYVYVHDPANFFHALRRTSAVKRQLGKAISVVSGDAN